MRRSNLITDSKQMRLHGDSLREPRNDIGRSRCTYETNLFLHFKVFGFWFLIFNLCSVDSAAQSYIK